MEVPTLSHSIELSKPLHHGTLPTCSQSSKNLHFYAPFASSLAIRFFLKCTSNKLTRPISLSHMVSGGHHQTRGRLRKVRVNR